MTDLNANKDLVRAFIAAWNDRDFDQFGDLMADAAVLHVGGTAVSCDPAGTRAIAEEWTTAFPDWRFDLLRLIAEGDQVAAHMPYRGTFTKPILGVTPTGRSARVDEMVIFRIADGKIAEAWEVYDECGMRRQLGAPPPSLNRRGAQQSTPHQAAIPGTAHRQHSRPVLGWPWHSEWDDLRARGQSQVSRGSSAGILCSSRSAEDCEYFPRAGHAFEIVAAAALQLDGGPATRSRMVRETRISLGPARAATRAPVCTAIPADLARGPALHLTGMDSGADPQAQGAHAVAHGLGAGDRPRRAVEQCQRPVARSLIPFRA